MATSLQYVVMLFNPGLSPVYFMGATLVVALFVLAVEHSERRGHPTVNVCNPP